MKKAILLLVSAVLISLGAAILLGEQIAPFKEGILIALVTIATFGEFFERRSIRNISKVPEGCTIGILVSGYTPLEICVILMGIVLIFLVIAILIKERQPANIKPTQYVSDEGTKDECKTEQAPNAVKDPSEFDVEL